MAQVTDPVCGREIDVARAVEQTEFEGETYYFCSPACANEFKAHPTEVLERHEPPFTTKGFTAPKFGAAGSGGAEYERLPEAHDPKRENR